MGDRSFSDRESERDTTVSFQQTINMLTEMTPSSAIISPLRHCIRTQCIHVAKFQAACRIPLRLKPTLTRKLSYRKEDCVMCPLYGCPENFPESLSTPTATFPEILMGTWSN